MTSLFHNLIQDTTLHLVVVSPYFFCPLIVSQFFLTFHDLDSLEEYCKISSNLDLYDVFS